MFRFFDDAMIIISSRKLNDATGTPKTMHFSLLPTLFLSLPISSHYFLFLPVVSLLL